MCVVYVISNYFLLHTIYGSYASKPIVPSWLKTDLATEVNVEIYFHIVSNIFI